MLPRLLFIRCLLFFKVFFLSRLIENWPPRWSFVESDKGAKKKTMHVMVDYELIFFSPFLFFNHISIELNNNTTWTQMYLLSELVNSDSVVRYDLTVKPPRLLLSLSRRSPATRPHRRSDRRGV